jgi:hypothetical protein
MNRLTLVLNTAILVVTFVVALAAGDVQGELLSTAARTTGSDHRSHRFDDRSAATVLRVVQSMENFYPERPGNELCRAQIEAIRDAIEICQSGIESGINATLRSAEDDQDLRGAISHLGRSVRVDIESALARGFEDPTIVRRLATEVIRNSR